MSSPGDEFDEDPLEPEGPLLPAEDRLWRHPSELDETPSPLRAEQLEARRTWLARQPTRAGAWSAGLTGALLATGLVLLGTHLSSLLARSDPAPGATSLSLTTTTLLQPISAVLMRPNLKSAMERVAAAMAVVETSSPAGETRGVGIVVHPGGIVLTAAAVVAHATSITVTLADDQSLVARPEGTDPETGVAVLRVNASNLDSVAFAGGAMTAGASVAVVSLETASGLAGGPPSTQFGIGTVLAASTSIVVGDGMLFDCIDTDVPLSSQDLGAALLDARGRLTGIVTTVGSSGTLATPSWLAEPVAEDLAVEHKVVNGDLGITGKSEPGQGGVEVATVTPDGPAALGGVRPGDVISTLDGRAVASMPDLRARLHVLRPGDVVVVGIDRKRHPSDLVVALGGP